LQIAARELGDESAVTILRTRPLLSRLPPSAKNAEGWGTLTLFHATEGRAEPSPAVPNFRLWPSESLVGLWTGRKIDQRSVARA